MDAGRRVTLRVVLVGNFGVGKTSLLRQYLDRTFSEVPSNTMQEDERETSVTVDGRVCDLIVTDTAGQEQFRSFTSSYFRDKHGALAVFDVSDPVSLVDLAHWIREIRKWDANTDIVVVGNKMDLESRKVSTREGEEFASSMNAVYVETSAKLEINCIKAFETLSRLCSRRLEPHSVESGTTPTGIVSLKPTPPGRAGGQPQQNFSDNSCPCSLM